MNAQTYYDLNRTIERLAKVISHERYKDERMGTIPPDAMPNVLVEVADTFTTLTDLTNLSTDSNVFESIRLIGQWSKEGVGWHDE